MGLLDYFKKVDTVSAEKLREFLKTKKHEDYYLIDVRQPDEYEEGHLPGSMLIPLPELAEKTADMSKDKTAVAYCTAGIRSRAAASMLKNEGFKRSVSLKGGINAWNGILAEGSPESGTAYFDDGDSTEDLIALAYALEEGSRLFYQKISSQRHDEFSSDLFQKLFQDEELHKKLLAERYKQISGKIIDYAVEKMEDFGEIMEGGMRVKEALDWIQNKEAKDVLMLAASLETNSYDLYVRMERRMPEEDQKLVFRLLAGEEKHHLQNIINEYEKYL